MALTTNFTQVDTKLPYLIDGEPAVITGSVTKTVGSGKDFELFHDAMTWAMHQTTTGHGAISLVLDDGTHLIGEPSTFNQIWWSYYQTSSADITIKSASGVSANCIITMPSTDDGDQYPGLFYAFSGGYLRVYDVTINPTANGYPYENADAISNNGIGSLAVSNCSISNCNNAIFSPSKADVTSSFGKSLTIDNCTIGINATASGSVRLRDGGSDFTVTNCDTGLSAINGADMVVTFGSVTFTTNSANTNIPLNEIQYNGSYISDGTAALSFKP